MQRKFCVAFAFATKKTAGTGQPAARRTHEQTMYLRAAGPAAPTVPIYTLLFLPGTAYFIQPELEQRIILADPFHLGQIRFYGQFVEFGEDFFTVSIRICKRFLDAIFYSPFTNIQQIIFS